MVSFHGLVAFFAGLCATLALAGCSGSTGDGGLTGSSSSGSSSSSGGSASDTSPGASPGTTGGTTGNPVGEQLFAAPSGDVTSNSILGVWGGVIKDGQFTFDTRTKLEARSVTFATRCQLPNGKTSAVASVVAAARVSETEVAVLETKNDERKTGDITCRASAHAGSTTACEVVDGFQHDCFALDGLKLVLYGTTPFDKIEMIKISD
jgi:hypothetical protein